MEADEEERDFHCYHDLEGATLYDKLRLLRQSHCNFMRITERSKEWWDKDLSE